MRSLTCSPSLFAVHGVFHGKLHFSSSRATLWFINDPLRYRILDIEDLTDPGIVLTYRRDPYPEDAVIPLEKVGEVFRTFRELRFMDETIYLRAGSLNIFNGMVGLNFSCDGSHYMPWDEFLEKSLGFWLGTGESIITRENQRNELCQANCQLLPEKTRFDSLVLARNLSTSASLVFVC